jgi:hypothetical protein
MITHSHNTYSILTHTLDAFYARLSCTVENLEHRSMSRTLRFLLFHPFQEHPSWDDFLKEILYVYVYFSRQFWMRFGIGLLREGVFFNEIIRGALWAGILQRLVWRLQQSLMHWMQPSFYYRGTVFTTWTLLASICRLTTLLSLLKIYVNNRRRLLIRTITI